MNQNLVFHCECMKNTKRQINKFSTIKEFFQEYLISMFNSLKQLIDKQIDGQNQRIKSTQTLIENLFLKIGQIQAQNYDKNSQNKTKSILPMDSVTIQDIKKSIQSIQTNISNLKFDKTQSLLSLNSFIEYGQKVERQNKIQSPLLIHTQMKIQNLNNQIKQIANEAQYQNNYVKLQKSRSLINLAYKKYACVSGIKKYDYGSFVSNKHKIVQNEEDSPLTSNYQYFQNQTQKVVNNSLIHNKMPLINKSKSMIKQLISSINDLEDSNLVKYFLNKALKRISNKFCPLTKRNQYEAEMNFNKFNSSIHNKKQKKPQYFVQGKDQLKNYYQQNLSSECSIANHKQINYKQINHNRPNNIYEPSKSQFLTPNFTKCEGQGAIKQNLKLESFITKSKQKSNKYFQRTSNEKIMLLKKKFQPTGYKF